MSLNNAPLCVIAGVGDVGGRLAQLRIDAGDAVLGLRRSACSALAGMRALSADLATGAGLEQLPRVAQTLVFCAAPDARTEAAYRALYFDGVRRLLDRVDCHRVVFVSSTAVYAEDAGEWVDEATPARPPQFNGQVLLASEAPVLAHAGGCVVRCSGIYGPGRDALLCRARAAQVGRQHWSNRIHVQDVAAAISHVLDLPSPQALYLANDDLPTKECELFNHLREREGLPAIAAAAEPDSGRRISNRRLRQSGWHPAYVDGYAGYAALLATVG